MGQQPLKPLRQTCRPRESGPSGGDRPCWRGQRLTLGTSWLRREPDGGHCLPACPGGWHPGDSPAGHTGCPVSGGAAPRGLTRRPHGGSGSGKPEPADSGAVAHGGRARTVPPGGRRNNGLPVGNQPLALKRPSLRPPGTHGSLPQAEPQNQLPGALSGCGSQPGASATPVPGNDSLAGGRRSWQGLGQTHPSIQAQPQQGCSLAPSSGTT